MVKLTKKIKILNYSLLIIFLVIFLGLNIKYTSFSNAGVFLSSCNDATSTTTTTKATTTTTKYGGGGYACKQNPLRCVTVSSGGTYSTMSACTAACFVSYNCNYSTGNCVKVSDMSGSYWSKSACDNDCKVTYTYVCKSNGSCVKEASNQGYETLSTCQACCPSANCAQTTYWSCDDATGSCYIDSKGDYNSSYTCNQNCGSSTPSPTTPPPTTSSSTTTTTTTTTTITTTTTVPPCVINKFELPKRAWVDIETTASWSTNNCDTAEIRCISDDCIEGVENLSGSVEPGFPTKSKNFTIKAPGTYRYELEACGPGPNNCKTYEDVLGTGLEYIEIEALHLPWWEEIIPILPDNLQGFLRGILGFN